jgi:hypothetical protein
MSAQRGLLVLTGAPGAGKSSVLEALTTLLEIEGVEFSALESEQLARGNPWLPPSQWLPQLAAVTALQREVGRSLFLVAATTETSEELRQVVEAVGTDRAVVVLLVAQPHVVADRVGMREPDAWPGKPGLVAHARELAVSMPRDLHGVDVRIETDHRDPVDVAAEVREVLVRRLGIHAPPSRPLL